MAEKAWKKRNYLSLEKKVEVIKYAQRNPGTNVRDLGTLFSCGKFQRAQKKKMDSLLSMYHSNVSGSRIHTKMISRVSEFVEVKEALCE